MSKTMLKTPRIHVSCLFQGRRTYSSQSPLPPAPPKSGAAKLTTRRLISLHGPEAAKFLQGIVSNNVKLDSRNGLFAAFLTAQGKVLHDVFIYPTTGSQWHADNVKTDDAGYIVEVDAATAPKLLAHLKRHKLRAKLQLRMLDQGELDVWSAWKEDEKWTAHPPSFGDSGESNTDEQRNLNIVDTRAAGLGHRLLLPSTTSLDQVPMLQGLQETGLDAYTIRRYLRGVPEGQNEIPRDDVLPMNSNFDVMGGIDFRKGCYVGQELTIRTHHTGVVRRRVLPVTLFEAGANPPEKLQYDPSTTVAQPEHDADIKIEGKRGRPGKWISGVGNVGLAMCRLELMTDLVVTGEPSTFSAEDRFTIKAGSEGDSQTYGVKTFVPDWMRGKIRTPKVQKRVE